MILPKEISPNPLITSTVELRFVSDLSESEALSQIYPAFAQEFPKLNPGLIPKELKQSSEEQFKYSADYIMNNDNFSIAFSNRVFTFDNIGNYVLWGNYFPFIKSQVDKFLSLKIAKKIERVGIRYVSVFSNLINMDELLINTPSVSLSNNYSQEMNLFRSLLKVDEVDLLLQIARSAKVQKREKSFSGLLIDIDASTKSIDENKIIDIIDSLHTEQKKLFFGLLKPDFINTLNPTY